MTVEQGAEGERGPRGDQGSFGHPGHPGEKGETGRHGHEGKRGRQGIPGEYPRAVVWAFMGLIVLTTLLVAVGAFAALQARHASQDAERALAVSQVQIEENKHRIAESLQASRALCGLRANVKVRLGSEVRAVQRSAAFLEAHPDGVPALGISAAVLRASLESAKADLRSSNETIRTLDDLKCPPSGGAN
jgi:hypothetical protein